MRADESCSASSSTSGLGGASRHRRLQSREFGEKRVWDTPLAEQASSSHDGVGCAIEGLKAGRLMQFAGRSSLGFDQLVTSRKMHYRQVVAVPPIVVRPALERRLLGGPFHCIHPEALVPDVARG